MKKVFCIAWGLLAVGSFASVAADDAKLADFYKRYPMADLNKDKKVSISEARTFIKLRIHRITAEDLQNFRKQVPQADTNKDGVLTKTEFIKYWRI